MLVSVIFINRLYFYVVLLIDGHIIYCTLSVCPSVCLCFVCFPCKSRTLSFRMLQIGVKMTHVASRLVFRLKDQTSRSHIGHTGEVLYLWMEGHAHIKLAGIWITWSSVGNKNSYWYHNQDFFDEVKVKHFHLKTKICFPKIKTFFKASKG